MYWEECQVRWETQTYTNKNERKLQKENSVSQLVELHFIDASHVQAVFYALYTVI